MAFSRTLFWEMILSSTSGLLVTGMGPWAGMSLTMASTVFMPAGLPSCQSARAAEMRTYLSLSSSILRSMPPATGCASKTSTGYPFFAR